MSDEIWRRDEIESPCVKVCVIHPRVGLCTGCLRTLDAIADWSTMTPAERRAVIEALPGRRAQLRQRRGGRAGRLREGDAA